MELDPFFGPAHHTLAVLYARKGMHQEAIAEVEQGLGQYRCGARDEIARGLVYAMTGQLGEARERLSRLKQAYAPRDAVALGCAAIHAALGERGEALDWLERACQERDGSLVFVGRHPEFESLYDDERFQGLLDRIGVREPPINAHKGG